MSSSLPQEESLESEATAEHGPFRRTFSALHYRDFRLLWFGAFTSTTGTFMQAFAQAYLVYKLTNSAFLLGVDGFLSTGPMLLFSLFGGVIADRVSRRRIMILSQYVQMTLAFVLAFLIWSGTVEVWHILLMSFLTGVAQSISGPAYISLLPLLVRRDDVANAVAMNSMQFNLARVIGPSLGGIVYGIWGPAACFAINGLSFVAVVIALSMIHTPPAPEKSGSSILEEMREGFRFVRHRPNLQLLTFLAFAGTFLGMPLFTMLPVIAKRFELEERGLSFLQADYGLGSVVGALLVAATGHTVRKGRLALFLQLAFAILLAAFGISRNLALSLLLAFVAGACVVSVIALYSSLVQLTTSDQMRGRVMSIFMLAFRGGMPLGNLVAGSVAERWSITWALAINGIVLAVIAAIFIARGTNLDAHR